MENKIQIGTVVYLKSGSPPLTVTAIVGSNAQVVGVLEDGETLTLTLPLACFSTEQV
mgnify:FL=1